jgi:hypothetical protein
MPTISSLNSGLLGIQRGFEGLRRDAGQIASASVPEPDVSVVKPLVNLVADRSQASASAKVIKSYDEAIGSLLDVKA